METTQELDFLSVFLPLVAIIFIIAIGVFLLNQHFQRNLFRQRIQQEELRNHHQIELLKSSIQAQETERKRIARNLHDELGAKLSMTRMQLIRLEELSKNSDEAIKSSLLNVRTITESALSSTREISHRLMPPQLEVFGLESTFESLTDQINTAGELKLEFKIIEISRLPWEIEVAIYRVVMELLQNTMKHSGAKNVNISLSNTNDQIKLFYEDDGRGMQGGDGKGMGLKNVEARVTSIGGNFELMCENGFKALLIVPLDTYENE